MSVVLRRVIFRIHPRGGGRDHAETGASEVLAEFKDEAVRLVIESGRPIAQVARELMINDGTLGHWVARYRDERPVAETPLMLSERARLAELERENRQLRLDNEFLGKAAALLGEGSSVGARYAFIAAEKASCAFPVSRGCRLLGGSTSGFYAWRERPDSPTRRRRSALWDWIRRFHTASGDASRPGRCAYGGA